GEYVRAGCAGGPRERKPQQMCRNATSVRRGRAPPLSWASHRQASRSEAQTPSCAFSNQAHSAFRIPSSAFIFSARVLKASPATAKFPVRELVSPAFQLATVADGSRQLSRRPSVRFSQSVFLRKDHQSRCCGVRRYYRASRRIRILALVAS